MKERPSNGPMETFSLWFSGLTMWLPAAIVGCVTVDIIYRYIFVSSTLWVNETSLWLGGVIYLTSGLYAMHHRSHIRISVIYDAVSPRTQKIFDILSLMCMAIFAFFVLWGMYNTAIRRFTSWELLGTVFDPPIPATNLPLIIVTCLLIVLQVISNFIRDWGFPTVVRQAYDVISTVAVCFISYHVISITLGWAGHDISKIPSYWQFAITLAFILIPASAIWGLIRDFNTEPEPFEEQ